MTLTLDDIYAAQERLAAYLHPTRLEPAASLGPQVYLKLENTNITRSFKVRGALNAVLALDAKARQRGLVTASSGNHAQGLAYAAALISAPAKILMPEGTPQRKIDGVSAHGAEAVVFGATYDEAEAEARRLERESGYTYISPYNDVQVAAGQGTIGLEILEQLPEVARVLVCVGGGGLIAGVATAIKALRPQTEVIGVGARNAPPMYNRFHQTQLPERYPTLAEALAGEIEQGSITVPLIRQHVDDMVLVSEDEIAEAMRWCVFQAGWVVEGGGAVAVAAALSEAVPLDERPTAILVSGGNVDAATLERVLCG